MPCSDDPACERLQAVWFGWAEMRSNGINEVAVGGGRVLPRLMSIRPSSSLTPTTFPTGFSVLGSCGVLSVLMAWSCGGSGTGRWSIVPWGGIGP